MMHEYNPDYPIIHTREIEECSSLDWTMDEEAGSWAAAVANSDNVNVDGIRVYAQDGGIRVYGSNESVATETRAGRFTTVARRVNATSPVKKCLFFTSVFAVLSSVGLAAVGMGLVWKNGEVFGFVNGGGNSANVGGVDESGVSALEEQVERSTDDDLIEKVTSRISPGVAPVKTTAPTYLFSTPYPTPSAADGTAPTSTDSIVMDSIDDIAFGHDVELSMSMDFNDDMSMEFQDFEQFDIPFDMSMSMNNAVEETVTEPSTSIVLDEEDIIPLVSETDSTQIVLDSTTIATTTPEDTTTPAVATKPSSQDCVSSTCAVELSSELLMEYQLLVPETTTTDVCEGCALEVKMTYDGIAWLGFALSNDGAMIGSEAVIGVPVKNSKQIPQKYSLGGQSVDAVQPMPSDQQTLQNASIKIGRTSDGVKTVMKFTKLLHEEGELQISTSANTFLWAYGSNETLGYHAARSSFTLDLMSGETIADFPSTPMVTDPTEGVISVDDVEIVNAAVSSTTVAATIALDSVTDLSVDLATEATVASSSSVTEGTIVSGAFDIDLSVTEPTTQEISIDTNVNATSTPTYYPTATPVLISEVITPVADTFVEFNSSKAFGLRKWVKVDGEPERITLIRFDMSSLVRNKAVTLLSAKLRMLALTSSPFGGKVDIVDEDICGEWDEDTLTWTNAPPGVFEAAPESLGSFGASQEFEWNEAELTLNLRYLPLQFTVKITSDRADGVTYASKENVTAVPELILEYMGTPYEETEVPTTYPTEKASLVQASIELTDSPTMSPITDGPTPSPVDPIEIEVLRDAMLRDGQYSDERFGYDSTIAMKSSTNPDYTGKSILQFDLSDVPSDYNYELKLFITYTGSDDERTLSIFSITDVFRWGEEWITWDRLGNPDLQFLGSAIVRPSDVGSYVSFPLGELKPIEGRINLIVEITSEPSEGSKVDYKAREAGSDTPVLIGMP